MWVSVHYNQCSGPYWLIHENNIPQEAKGPESTPSTVAPPKTGPPAKVVEPAAQQGGVLRGWFPGWSGWGWYGSQAAPPDANQAPLEESEEPYQLDEVQIGKSELIPWVLKMKYQNLDFYVCRARNHGCTARFSWEWHSAEERYSLCTDWLLPKRLFSETPPKPWRYEVSLSSHSLEKKSNIWHFLFLPIEGTSKASCLIELECSTVQMALESRPRTHGLKFSASVGGLYLRDKMTKDSIMPVLVAPQSRVSPDALVFTPWKCKLIASWVLSPCSRNVVHFTVSSFWGEAVFWPGHHPFSSLEAS